MSKLQFYDINDGDDSILITDGKTAVFGDRGPVFEADYEDHQLAFRVSKGMGLHVELDKARDGVSHGGVECPPESAWELLDPPK